MAIEEQTKDASTSFCRQQLFFISHFDKPHR